MQFTRYIALPKSSLNAKPFFLILRILLFIGIAIYLWQQLNANQEIIDSLTMTEFSWKTRNILALIAALFLLPVNWLLEARKWQLIARKSNISLWHALKGVVLGLTMDNVLPAGTGAISGRVITISKENRSITLPGILAGQMLQSAITFIFGLFGLALIWDRIRDFYQWPLYQVLLSAGVLVIILLVVSIWKQKILTFLAPLKGYSTNLWLVLAVLSLGRYMVFLLQFLLLAYIFSPITTLVISIGCATWVFVARTFMPQVSNFERLGIRALAVVFFMGIFSLPAGGMLITVVVLWIINLLIPSLFGLALIKKLNFNTPFG